MTLGGAALAGLALTSVAKAQTTTAPALTDNDYLNFALNLEYLEGNFYTLASSGQTLEGAGIAVTGTGTPGTVITKTGGPAACKVPFTNTLIQGYAAEIAKDEQNHVNFIRTQLGSLAVAQPAIDLYNSFNTLWTAVLAFFTAQKITTPITQTTFDPFASDLNFLLGAYIFEVGVTAYTGTAALLTASANLNAAAGLQATEAYHYGLIRTSISALDQLASPFGKAGTAATITTGISGVRAQLDGTGTTASPRGDDLGLGGQLVELNGLLPASEVNATNPPLAIAEASSLVNASTTSASESTNATTGVTTVSAPPGTGGGSLATARTPAQVLAIAYAGGTGKGGFFPAALNGNIA